MSAAAQVGTVFGTFFGTIQDIDRGDYLGTMARSFLVSAAQSCR
jgi:hypothetical protein